MARVFSAVDIQDPEILDQLQAVRKTLNLGFNPVSRQRMHITLEFFEDIDKEEIEEVKQAMDRIEIDSFQADIKGLGAFPSEDHIRVVWAGVEAEELHELYRQVSGHEIRSDNSHEFKPHITLIRVRSPSKDQKKKLQRTIREFRDYEIGNLEVNRIKLFESDLDSKSNYKQLYKKEL